MKKRLTFAIQVLLLFPAIAFAEKLEVTDGNLTNLFESKNLKVAASALTLEAAIERDGFLLRSFLPSFELYAGHESFTLGQSSRKNQPVYGAMATINLFNGGRDSLEDEKRNLQIEKKTVELKRVKSEELQKARSSYWSIMHHKAKASLLNSMVQLNQDNLNSALRRIRSGVATESDRVEFEMNGVDLRRELAVTEVALKAEIRNLAILLNVPESTELVFPENLTHDHEYESLLKHSEREHAFLHRESEIIASQELLEATSTKRAFWPKLDAFAAYHQFNEREKEYPAARDRTESVLGLRVTMSLAAGLEANQEGSAKAKEAKALSSLAELQERVVENHFHFEMNELKLLHSQVHDAEKNIERAERYYKLTQSEYGRGVKNSPDVLGAAERLLATKLKMLEIIRDFQISKSHVLAKIGK